MSYLQRLNEKMTCVTSFMLLLSIFSNTNNEIWTWNCVEDKCVKQEYEGINAKNNKTEYIIPLEICKLLCGSYGSIWPLPTGHIHLSKTIIPIHPDTILFDLSCVSKNTSTLHLNNIILQMKQKFIQNLRTMCYPKCIEICDAKMVLIRISTISSDTKITWKTNESYQLRVNTTENHVIVSISATTIFGARHALETLLQLATVIEKNNTNSLILIDEAFVIDSPVYTHRGLLIDTSRHYVKVNTIKKIIDGMGHSKLNVLHWHATDSHSFPLQLPRIPELARYGAYSPEKIYTLRDIGDIIFYAKTRGVRVIMEIDSPAHAGNGWQWGEKKGLGKLALCINKQPWQFFCTQPPCGQLNPYNPNTFGVLRSIYKDLLDVFPDEESFHMGGDEVFFGCWNSSEEIVDQMRKKGLKQNIIGFLQLWANFHLKSIAMLDYIRGSSKTPVILWSSDLTKPENIHLFNSHKSKIIIQVWLDALNPLINYLLNLKYTLIISTRNAWYLDHGVWGSTLYYPWTKMYDNQIPEFSKGVLGGEVCMWGEYVDDSTIESRIWPRAAAVAERLWSNPKSWSHAASTRFFQHRERLVKMGIPAEAVTPEWCYRNDGQCL